MHTLIESINAHPFIWALGAYAVFSSVVGALEKPDASSGKIYRYFYRLGHLLAFNVGHAIRVKFPEYVPDKEAADAEQQRVIQ